MDQFTKQWITEAALEELPNYRPGEITVRGLYYRLVKRGMTNSQNHYKRVVKAMTDARWDGLVKFNAFSDLDRVMVGSTQSDPVDLNLAIDTAKDEIKNWMTYFFRNRWEGQPNYVEVFIEKKALQGVFAPVCRQNRVALGACKGYPSLTFLYDAASRLENAIGLGMKPVILYFGDYDPSGEDIPRSIVENLDRLGISVELDRRALLEHQVLDWDLPPAPTKATDSRSKNWDGLGQVELDAVEPHDLQNLCGSAIAEYFDEEIYQALRDEEEVQIDHYRSALKEYVRTL